MGSRVAETEVKAGGKLGDAVEVLEGLKAGERVVINPPGKIRDGSRVKLAQQ